MLAQSTRPPTPTSTFHTWRQTARDLLDDYTTVEGLAVEYAVDAEAYRTLALVAYRALLAEQDAHRRTRRRLRVEQDAHDRTRASLRACMGDDAGEVTR